MADLYWVGGTGTHDNVTNHYATSSGGTATVAAPTSTDNVIFDTLSNPTAYTVTIGATLTCANLTIGNPLAGSLTLAGTSAMSIYGNFSIADITRTYSGAITFRATTTGKTLTFNGETMGSNTVFDGVGGGWTLQDAWNNGSTASITLTNGSLDFNGKNVTCGTFSSSNSNTRTLTMGASTLEVHSSGSAIDFGTTTNLTFNAGTSTIFIDAIGTSGCSIDFGGLTLYNLTFDALLVPVGLKSNVTVSNNLSLTGLASGANRMLLYSCSSTTLVLSNTQRTITANNITSLTNTDFVGIVGAGSASWTGSSLGDGGNNSGITFTSPVTRYWVGNGGSMNSTSHWSTSSGGASGASIPLIHDTVIFDSNSITSSGQTIANTSIIAMPTLDFTNVANNPTFEFATSFAFLFGGLILKSGMSITNSVASTVRFWGRGSSTINLQGITLDNGANVICDTLVGTITLASNFTIPASRTFTLTSGSFDANDFNMTAGAFSSSNSNTRTISMGSGTWELTSTSTTTLFDLGTITGLTLNQETSTIKFTGARTANYTFAGGGETFNNFWDATTGAFALTVSGSNTFNDFKMNAGRTVKFTTGTTQHMTTWSGSGTAGNLITINSTTTGTHTLVLDGAGPVNADYLNIQHSIATPADTWFAGNNSTDNQDVPTAGSGWIFSASSASASTSLSPSSSQSPSSSVSLSISPSPSPSPSPTPSSSISLSPSSSASPSQSISSSPSASASPSSSVSRSPSASVSSSISPSPSSSQSPSSSISLSISPSPSSSVSLSISKSPSSSLSASGSDSPSASVSLSPSASVSFSPSTSFSASPSPISWTNQPKNTTTWNNQVKVGQ